MKNSLTQSMTWLHTWGGLVFGWVLFAIFLTGTLSVFPEPITAWMQPELASVRPSMSDETMALGVRTLEREGQGASRWLLRMPTDDLRLLRVTWRPAGTNDTKERLLDPATGQVVQPRATAGGSFFVRFHYTLLLRRAGTWIVAAAVLMMLVAVVTGVIIHKKIFKEFFTFRPGAAAQRPWLDAHTLVGVLVLPFHVMISYTGLIIVLFTLMPAGIQVFFGGDRQAFNRALDAGQEPRLERAAAGIAAPLLPIAELVRRAETRWHGLPVTSFTVDHPGDRHAIVRASHFSRQDHQTYGTEVWIAFDGVTGDVLQEGDEIPDGVQAARQFSFDLHTARIGGISTKWFFFVMSAAGCMTIATGLVMWTVKRGRRMALSAGVRGYHLVACLNVATMAGLTVAALVYFWSNRLIPADLPGRQVLEQQCFGLAWALCAVHAVIRRRHNRRAWREQLATAALLALFVPLLNAVTGGMPLPTSVAQSNWRFAGFDLTVLGMGAILAWTAWKLGPSARVTTGEVGVHEASHVQQEGSSLPA